MKLCVDCVHYQAEHRRPAPWMNDPEVRKSYTYTMHWCRIQVRREQSVITGEWTTIGEPVLCQEERERKPGKMSCGPLGKYFARRVD